MKVAWKTVAAFGSSDQALEALERLEEAKIKGRILQDGTSPSSVAFPWIPTSPLGGHAVQVEAQDLDDAAAALGITLSEDEADPDPANPFDVRMNAAFLLATFGVFVCPGIAQIVSLVLIGGTPKTSLTDVGRARRRRALTVDIVVLFAIALLIATDSAYSYRWR